MSLLTKSLARLSLEKKMVAGFGLALAMLAIVVALQHRIIHALIGNNRQEWVILLGAALALAFGLFAIWVIHRDIEQRQRAEAALAQARRDWEEIFQAVGQSAMILDPDQNILAVNRATLEMTGKPELELVGRKCHEVFHGTDKPVPNCPFQSMSHSGSTETREIVAQVHDRVCLVSCTPILDVEHRLVAAIHLATDITERTRAEVALRQASAYNRSLIEASLDPLVTIDPNGKITDANSAMELATGYSREELMGTGFKTYFKDPERAWMGFQQAYRDGWAQDSELEIRHYDGRTTPVLYNASVYRDDAGKVIGVFAAARDISERRKADKELRRLNRALKALSDCNEALAHATDESALLNEVCRILIRDNTYLLAWVGYAEQDEAKTVRPVAHAGFEAGYLETLKITWADTARGRGPTGTAIRTGQPSIMRNISADPAFAPWREEATRRGYASSAGLPLLAGGKALGALMVYAPASDAFDAEEVHLLVDLAADLAFGIQDLRLRSERQRAEHELRASETRYRRLFESSKDGILILDAETGEIIDVNEFMLKLLGYSSQELLGKQLWEIGLLGDRGNSKDSFRTLQEKEYIRYENLPLETKEGKRTEVEFVSNVYWSGERKVIQCNVRDVSERRQLEEQLRQSQKMEAIGLLAGGVAHDFNNLLTVISGYSELMLGRMKPEDGYYRAVTEIRRASERATVLTRQLLAFSRRQILSPQILDLNTVVSGMLTILRRLIGEEVDLVVVPGKDLGRVRADLGQIEQIVLNLGVNARDAMPGGGKLTIETANLELDEAYAREHEEAKPGPYVMLSVTDTGVGMDAETQKRIFDPFFTTKEKGKGTGLGLSTVYGIVRQSGGSISVSSEPDHGTTFKICLPRADESAKLADSEGRGDAPDRVRRPTDRGGLPATQQVGEPIQTGGSETILLVEDEPSVRTLVHQTLESKGYRVLVAKNGPDAIAVAEQQKEPIHLLITDVAMPEMSGRPLAEHMLLARPQMKVLFMTGYTDDEVIRHGHVGAGSAVIQKPFTGEALSQKVREMLRLES